jgi:hypothetical protein
VVGCVVGRRSGGGAGGAKRRPNRRKTAHKRRQKGKKAGIGAVVVPDPEYLLPWARDRG